MKKNLLITVIFLNVFCIKAQDFHEQFKGKLDLATSYFDKGDFDNFKKQFELSNVYLEDVSPEKLSNEELNLYTLCLFRCVYQGIDNSNNTIQKSIKYLEYNNKDAISNSILAYYYENGIGFTKDINKAKEYYLKSIDLGAIYPMVALGRIYENEKKYDKAIEYYQKAVNTNPNDKEAMNAGTNIGWLLYNGYGTNIDKEKAIKLWEELAEYNCGSAIYKLAYHYFNQKNYIKSKEYLDKGILLYNKDCCFLLGDLYEFGYNTIEIDKEKARQLYEKGISTNRFYHYGYYKLGYYYKNQKQYNLAKTYFEKAIELGNNEAMVSLGYCFEMGYGVEQSYQKAYDYYVMASKFDNSQAYNNIGYYYEKGYYVEQNLNKAIEYYKKAIKLGNEFSIKNLANLYSSQLNDWYSSLEYYNLLLNTKYADIGYINLGYMYEKSLGVDKDLKKAFDYYNKSANLGNINGIRNVGICYRDGIGTKKDYELAEKYFSKACDKGVKKACEDLSHLKK